MGKHNIYQPKAQTSVNLDRKSLELLRYLKKKGFIVSVSEFLRETLNFALPFFIHMYEVKENIILDNVSEFAVKPPTAKTIKLLETLQSITHIEPSLKELREKHPNMPDYLYINEGK